MKRLLSIFMLLTIIGGGKLWAAETYTITSDGSTVNTSTGTKSFATETTYQATEHVQLYISDSWEISSGKITGTALPANGNGTYSYSNYLLPTSGAYLTITPSQNGTLVLNGSKNSGGNKYLFIQTSNTSFVSDATVTCGGNACAWRSDRNGYNVTETSGNIVATFTVQSGTTYYIVFDSFNAWSFTGFTFTKQKIDVANSDFGFVYEYKNTHYGETYEGNYLVNTHNFPVTYSSSNTNAATVNASTGEVTIQNVASLQSTTITASFAGNDDYNAKSATYSLNVAPALVYTEIAVPNLRYRPGVNGISGSQMSRSVGGFNLTFSDNEGIKCNNTNNFYLRTNSSGAKGSMTIALDENNNSGSNYIKKIVFTAWNAPSLSVNSVAKTSGTLTQTGTTEWTWTNFYSNVNSVTFSSEGENDESILISNIRVYTNSAPTFSKVTPVPAFNRSSDSYSTGATVNITDLTLNTTPDNFLFDYTFNAGTTGLTHTPYTTNTTWPGTITGTAANGTATIAANFSDSSNPFYNTVASTNVYTLTVNSGVKNTFVWDFTQGLSEVDKKLLNATSDTWVLSGSNWTPTGGTTISGPFSQNGIELEYVYGLELYNSGTTDTNTLIYGNGGGFRLNSGTDRYIRIPNLKAGDKVTILCNNYSKDRGLNIPSNITNDATATGWGSYGSTGEFTCVGYVTANGNVDLQSTSAMDIRSITVESTNNPWPTLNFTDGSTVNVELPYNGDPLTYTNALTSVPTGATATYSILLDKNSGTANSATINSSTGALTLNATGEVIVRATVSAGTYNSAYYCDYILNATQASEYASWTYTSDSKEIDGEDRPYQGTVTFTGSGKIDDTNRVITDVPGITLTIGASGEDWTVAQATFTKDASTWNLGLAAHNATEANRPTCTTGCYFDFTPTVNGELTVNYYTDQRVFLYKNNSNAEGSGYEQWDDTRIQTKSKMLIAGNKYTLVSKGTNLYLHSFTFRPAFLTPDEKAEQTATFEANSSTTVFPKLVHGDVGVRFSGNRNVVNLQSDGGVTLVGGGTTIVRGKVMSGENALTAYYTLNANVLSVVSSTPDNGEVITTLDNSVYQIEFNEEIAILNSSNFVILRDATDITSQCSIAVDNNTTENNYKKKLNISGFGDLSVGSTYTIRIKAGCISKSGDASVANAEIIRTFSIESTEPPLTWIYPTTTSAIRIGASIVLQTGATIDESYPSNGVWGTLTYEGDDNDEDYPMTIKAIKDNNKLVFKATKPMVPNKLYTLTIGQNQVKYDNSTNMITKDKVFLFTTGTGTGAAPILASSFPTNGSTIDLPSSSTKVDLYFDQNVELEPYTTVAILPVNGGENLASGTSEKLNDSGVLVAQSMTVDSENQKHLSFTIGSDIKYDLYYEILIPANTVTGPGGMPNEASTIKFKINRNPNSHEITDASFYPHTWDFNKFGNSSTSTSSAYKIKDSADKYDTYGSVKNCMVSATSSDGFTIYTNRGSDNSRPFDQGNDVYIATGSSSTYTLPEFEGIRISLVKPTQNRFEIRNITSKETNNKNLDGTDKWVFRMNGNTHYFTLSKVPKGKLYMVVSAVHLGINSPNAVFESVSGEDYTLSNNNTLLTGPNANRRVVINVNPTEGNTQQDVSFCVQNLSLEKIGVPVTSKKAQASFENYFTDCQSVPQRFELTNSFTGNNLTAYYIPTDGYTKGETTITMTPTQVAAANEGTIIKASKTSNDVPLFRTDVNTEGDGHSTYLVGVLENTTVTATETVGGTAYRNYFFTNLAGKVNDQGEMVGEKGSVALGFYRAVASSTLGAHKCYLRLPQTLTEDTNGSKSMIMLNILDWDDIITGVTRTHTEKVTPHNDVYYTLSGMRLSGKPTQSGLYIVNGKKVYVK